MAIPNLFIVGSWKAGTSSLYFYLKDHPDVFMSRVKEPHYFVNNSRFRPRIFCSLASYLRLFRKAKGAPIVGEASAYYFCMPESAKLICDFNPKAKIVIMLRHPVDTIYAFHTESLFLGRETHNLTDTLVYQDEHPDHIPNYTKLIRSWPERIQSYWNLFGKEQVHIIFFEDLEKRPLFMYQELLAFLGIDQKFTPSFTVHNPSKMPPPPFMAWLSASPIAILLMQIISHSAVLAEKVEDLRRKQFRHQKRAPLDPILRQKLVASYAPTIDALSQLLQRDLSHWKR